MNTATTCLGILLAILLKASFALSQCKVPYCTAIYEETMEEKRIIKQSSVEFCQVLLDYGSCLKVTARECRGDLIYLSSIAAVRRLLDNYNCSALIPLEKMAPDVPRPRPSIIPELPPNELPAPTASPRHCQFLGKERYRYCGLFGDPHLKTFKNSYQTCRVRGAWPLIDNPYLAVQVTNEQVDEGSPATVTTKVTVIIKSSGTSCTSKKTYEATSDQDLPAVFTDGTRASGPNDNVMLTLHEVDFDHQSVEIRLNFIKTTLVIRQVGKYLAFAAQMPEELVELLSEEYLQLCNGGCPLSERLDLTQAHGTKLSWQEALILCRDASGLSNEISNNLTDHYLDWCVFDVMTTGAAEADSFMAAAHSAQADALRFEPQALQNRTELKLRPRDTSSASRVAVFSQIFAWLIVTAAVTLV